MSTHSEVGVAVHYCDGNGNCHPAVIGADWNDSSFVADVLQLDAVNLGLIVTAVRQNLPREDAGDVADSYHYPGYCTTDY
jgi:hypothetical protein